MSSIKLKPEFFKCVLDSKPFATVEANFESLVSGHKGGPELITFYDFLIKRVRHQSSLVPKWAQDPAWNIDFNDFSSQILTSNTREGWGDIQIPRGDTEKGVSPPSDGTSSSTTGLEQQLGGQPGVSPPAVYVDSPDTSRTVWPMQQ